jgi:hypothetical protein
MEGMEKQTAVEWLEDNLIFEPWAEEHFKHNSECWDKAKEMEKQQLYAFYIQGGVDAIMEADRNVEQYYNETFKSE